MDEDFGARLVDGLFDTVSWLRWHMGAPARSLDRKVVSVARGSDDLLLDNHLSVSMMTIPDHLNVDITADVFDAFDTFHTIAASASGLRKNRKGLGALFICKKKTESL